MKKQAQLTQRRSAFRHVAERPMIFLKLIVTNLLRHRIRSLISIAGIAFSVAAMLTIVTVLAGSSRNVFWNPFE